MYWIFVLFFSGQEFFCTALADLEHDWEFKNVKFDLFKRKIQWSDEVLTKLQGCKKVFMPKTLKKEMAHQDYALSCIKDIVYAKNTPKGGEGAYFKAQECKI